MIRPHEFRCNECGAVVILALEDSAYTRWKSGELIQRVFPDLSEAHREIMISGTCGKCFDKLFAEEEN